MKSSRGLIGVAFMFLVLAVGLSILIWQGTSLAAKVGLFALGFGCGMANGFRMIRSWAASLTGHEPV